MRIYFTEKQVTLKFPMTVFEIQDTLDRFNLPQNESVVEFRLSEYDNMELPMSICAVRNFQRIFTS